MNPSDRNSTPLDLSRLHGAWLIDKPEGITSFGVLEALQRALRTRTGLKKSELPALGHGGTLDPFATGLLVVCVGRAVKLTRWFLGSDKTYIGRIRLGETTVPGDPTEEISKRGESIPTPEQATQAASRFVTEEYWQTPPMHSAKKQGGKALYELARAGLEVERKAQLCQITRFELSQFQAPYVSPQSHEPVVACNFLVQVTAGTYIRVLAQDLGKKTQSEAMLETLRRTASGPKRLESTLPLAELTQAILTPGEEKKLSSSPHWVPFNQVLDGLFPEVTLTEEETRDLIHGKKAKLQEWAMRASTPGEKKPSKTLLVRDHEHNLRAVFEQQGPEERWDIARVFPSLND
jgi:tRNA pseudouridine55 synthase